MSSSINPEARRAERFTTSIIAAVKSKTDEDKHWKEDTVLTTVSRVGASFTIEHQCQIGQLVSLMFQMPKHLRCYDLDEINYRVWGLVQNCHRTGDDGTSEKYNIGVAFIGKIPPPSYYKDACQSYRVAGIGEDGLWKIAETERAFVSRKEPRFPVALEVYIELLNKEKDVIADEQTVTENISFSGAAVLSDLSANVGDWVFITCEKYNFSSPAIIRSKVSNSEESFKGDNKHSKLHLEFIDDRFPLEEVKEI